jgi:uncharacterized Zn finger protein (UPF0148 family)
MSMHCQQCGFTNNATAKFCKQCGAPMPSSNTAPAATPPIPSESVSAAAPVVSGVATTCPQCGTARVAGKRFCRACGFDYVAAEQHAQEAEIANDAASVATSAAPTVTAVEPAQQPVEVALAAETASAAVEAAPDVAVAETPTHRTAEATHAAAPATDDTVSSSACPSCGKPRSAGKRFCLHCGARFADADTPPAPSQNKAAAQPAPQAAPQPSQASASNTTPAKKPVALIAGIAGVVAIGVALGAGLLLRSNHSSTDNVQPSTAASEAAASAPSAVSAPQSAAPQAAASLTAGTTAASDASSASEPAVPATTSASAPSSNSASTAAAAPSDASTPTTTEAPAAPTTAQPASVTDTSAPAQPPQATAPAAPTEQPAPQKPAAVAKPRKPATPPADANTENPTIRAAIAGNLADGNQCFASRKYDCAISNAASVLRLDPRNAQALALQRRAKEAQQKALDSLSIQ